MKKKNFEPKMAKIWSKKGLKLQKLAKNQVFSRILFKKPNFFNFFQKLQLISLKNLKKIEIEKVLTQKNGQKWQNLSVFLRKTLKNYLLPNLAILYLLKFLDLCYFLYNKKCLKLVKNKKNEVLPPKLAKNGPKWPKNHFF